MTPKMILALIDNYNDNHQNGWEQTRFISFINAKIAGNKYKKLQAFYQFPWEMEEDNVVVSNKKDILKIQNMFINLPIPAKK